MAHAEHPDLPRAAAVLLEGGLVVFPTETFYGLAARPESEAALTRLAALKGRGESLPLIAADEAVALAWVEVPEVLRPLCALWPGPLTVVGRPRRRLPEALLGPEGTVAIRVSSHPLARALAAAAGGVITSTSANLRGALPPAAVADLDPRIRAEGFVLDGGACAGGAPSTVVGERRGQVVIFRAGAISSQQLARLAAIGPSADTGGGTADATVDTLWRGRLTFLQPPRGGGYRFNLDPVLLAGFAPAAGHVLDLGCGCGVLGVLLLAMGKAQRVTGVEVQPQLAELARRSAARNGLADRLSVLSGDARRLELPGADAVVLNPPYQPASGPRSPHPGRDAARREVHGTLRDLVGAAARSLGGRGPLSAVLPIARKDELLAACAEHGLLHARLRPIRPRAGDPEAQILVTCSPGTWALVEVAPMIVHTAEGRGFTNEVAALVDGPPR